MRRLRPHHIPHGTLAISLGASIRPHANVRGATRGLVRGDTVNAAQMAARRLRIIIAGELAGAWGKFGGFGGQPCPLLGHLEACLRHNAEVMDRLSEEGELRPHTARSRMDPSGVSSVIFEPGRDRRLRVVDEQRRAYDVRTAQSGASKKNRGYPAPNAQGGARGRPREPASRNDRKRRAREERDSESRRAVPNSQDFK